MLVKRYFRGILLRATLAVTLVLLLIALSNKFVVLMSRAASGELPAGVLFELVALHVPELLGLLLPLGLFLGIILSVGRLYTTNEMTALSAGGVSWGILLRVVLGLSLIVMILVSIMTLWSMPQFSLYKEEILGQEESSILMQSLAPGRFHSLKDGALVFYVEEISKNKKHLKEVFIAEQPVDASQAWSVLTADTGAVRKDEDDQRFLVLSNGTRYEGTPGSNDYSIVEYETYGRLIEKPPQEVPMFNRVTPTSFLWSSSSLGHRAELQWRIALPLSVPILALIALGISKVPPRAGRYSKVLPGILIYIFYYNFLTISKRWIESDSLSYLVGLWWVHALAFLLGLFLYWQHIGRLYQWRYFFKKPAVDV